MPLSKVSIAAVSIVVASLVSDSDRKEVRDGMASETATLSGFIRFFPGHEFLGGGPQSSELSVSRCVGCGT